MPGNLIAAVDYISDPAVNVAGAPTPYPQAGARLTQKKVTISNLRTLNLDGVSVPSWFSLRGRFDLLVQGGEGVRDCEYHRLAEGPTWVSLPADCAFFLEGGLTVEDATIGAAIGTDKMRAFFSGAHNLNRDFLDRILRDVEALLNTLRR
jgi:hypothetical protein